MKTKQLPPPAQTNGAGVVQQALVDLLTLEARRWMLGEVLRIEAEVNRAAAASGQPHLSLINDQELARIEALMAANTWPEKWDGTEHRGDEWLPEILADGSVQPLLFSQWE